MEYRLIVLHRAGECKPLAGGGFAGDNGKQAPDQALGFRLGYADLNRGIRQLECKAALTLGGIGLELADDCPCYSRNVACSCLYFKRVALKPCEPLEFVEPR